MQVITPSEFVDWKNNPVTKAFQFAVADQIGQVKEALAYTAGMNPNEDNFRRGYLTAMGDVLQFKIEDLQETDDGN